MTPLSIRGVGQLLNPLAGLGASILPLSFDFTGSNDTALSTLGLTAGAQWTIQSNAANCAPTAGSELVTNGDFTAWTADDPDSWVVTGESGGDPEVSEVGAGEGHGGAGTSACNIYTTSSLIQIAQAAMAEQHWYLGSVPVTNVVGGTLKMINKIIPDPGGFSASQTLTFRATGTVFGVLRNTACDITIDNLSLKELTLADLICSVDVGQPNLVSYTSGSVTIVSGTQAGEVACLDDATTPANFLLAYHDGTNCHLEKCVAGTYTSLINASAAYNGVLPKIYTEKSGSDLLVDLEYDGSPVGTQQTVSDAGIVNNTIHGLFSTYGGNSLGTTWHLEAN